MVVYHLHGQTGRLTVWAKAENTSVPFTDGKTASTLFSNFLNTYLAQMKVYFPGLISAQYRSISIIIIIIIIIIILAYFVLSLILPFQKDRNSSFVSKCKVPTNQLCTSKMRKTGFVYVAVIAPCQTIWCKLSKIVEKWNDAATFLYPHCISHP